MGDKPTKLEAGSTGTAGAVMSDKVYLVIGALMDDRWVHAAFSDPLAAEECRRVLTAQQSRHYYEIEEVELDPPKDQWARFRGPQETQ